VTPKAARFREALDEARGERRAVGFVPTMGALHRGHLSLVRRARKECPAVAVSIFVNPLQFGAGEDFASYPRDLEGDLGELERAGVDVAFTPETDELYPEGEPAVVVEPGSLGERLEGVVRPGHFRGVCTVVAKLFNLAGPCRAYFGEKDAQQLALIRRMVADLDFPIDVVGCPTVREADGLALSSRNAYLSEEERRAATCLYEALGEAAALVLRGERDAHVVRAAMARRIGSERLAQLEYVALVDDRSFQEIDVIAGSVRALVAARFGKARLIDNLLLTQ
jgi:pantoate--beta-alanine ligase